MLPWRYRPDDPADAKPKPGFSLNWNYAENCEPNPIPEEGVCTFMGMPTCSRSGRGLDWPENEAPSMKRALDIMRKHGYRCHIPPKGWEPESGIFKEGEEELQYLKSGELVEVLGKTTDNPEFEIQAIFEWIYIRCNTPEGKEFVEKHIRSTPHFQLGLVHHDEQRFELSYKVEGISLVQRTGGHDCKRTNHGQNDCSMVGTLFELRLGPKTIAKALCSYRNSQTWAAGPTIELFEVAGEWRRRGFGALLLQELTNYFEEVFLVESNFPKPIKYNVCQCTSKQAFEFFMNQGFDDLDGIGVELGKDLGD